MANLEEIMRRVREAAELHGPGWIESQLLATAPPPVPVAEGSGMRTRARRSRPPDRLSPEVTPRVRRRVRSPSRDPLASSGQSSRAASTPGAQRNPRQRTDAEARTSGDAAVSVQRSRRMRTAAQPRADEPSAGRVRRNGRRRSPSVESGTADTPRRATSGAVSTPAREQPRGISCRRDARRPSLAEGREAVLAGNGGASHDRASSASECADEDYSDGGAGSEPGSGHRSTGRLRSSIQVPAAGVQPSASGGGGASGAGPCSGSSVSGRRGGAAVGSRSGGTAAGTSGPERLGESTTSTMLCGVEGGSNVMLESLQRILISMQDILGGRQASGGPNPGLVWGVSGAQGQGGGNAGDTASEVQAPAPPAPPVTATVAAAASEAPAAAGEKDKTVDDVRLADAAKGELYMCFEGPLGVHLKQEVRERIWKGEYVEIFSLLPLEKFNLDRIRPTESKKEEEERRRYRLIPRTFANWLQAFSILASVIGEKAPENCSALFCYVDSIGEAYRVYGGNAWLRYDEQFRQRKAVRPSVRWDHKDISLWMRLMAAPKGGQQSFRDGAGGSGGPGGRTATTGRGCCWQFNEGKCKFGDECRYKHECSGCGGAHALSRCFKKNKNKGGDSEQKRGDSSETGKDGAVSRNVSK